MRFVGTTTADAVASILARAAALEAGVVPAADSLPPFQAAAAGRARAAMTQWGGAIVADAVGTGKTHVALAILADHLRNAQTDAALVVPAALRAHWGPRLRAMARDAGARVWRIPGPHPIGEGPRVLWLSHAYLSRQGALAAAPTLVVIDEAHAFRNPATRRYRALAATCAAARVLLLTATPVNNSLLDLHAQIRLFAGDGTFADLGVPSLESAFKAAAAGVWPPGLDDVIAAIMIRRDRTTIARMTAPDPVRGPVLRFPHRLPPRVVGYRPDPLAMGRLLAGVEGLELRTLGLGAGPGRLATAELVRLLLLKRLESSPSAFRATLDRLLAYHRAFLDELAGGGLLRPRDHRAFAAIGQLTLGGLLSRPVPRGFDAVAAGRRASSAIDGLVALREVAATAPDPKSDALLALLDTEVADHRVLVFTEYRETADYIARRLRERHRIALVHGAGAWLGGDRCPRDAALAQFAPGTAVSPAMRADVLIATDVLAEGLDLQAADRVVSWDLPWNPVRLIQRIGRIDRLGSPHACIAAYLFLPEEGLDAMLGLLRRLRAKLAAIGRSVGPEPDLLGDGEDPERLDGLIRRARYGDPRLLDDLARDAGRGAALARLLEQAPADPQPPDAVPVAVSPAADRLLVALSVGGATRWLLDPPAPDARAAAATLLRAARDDPGPIPEPPAVRRLTAHARRIAADASKAIPSVGGVRTRSIRGLLAALAAVPGGPSAPLLARGELLVARLSRDGNAGLDARLRQLLRTPRSDAESLCTALETLFRAVPEPRGGGNARILGIIAPDESNART